MFVKQKKKKRKKVENKFVYFNLYLVDLFTFMP